MLVAESVSWRRTRVAAGESQIRMCVAGIRSSRRPGRTGVSPDCHGGGQPAAAVQRGWYIPAAMMHRDMTFRCR